MEFLATFGWPTFQAARSYWRLLPTADDTDLNVLGHTSLWPRVAGSKACRLILAQSACELGAIPGMRQADLILDPHWRGGSLTRLRHGQKHTMAKPWKPPSSHRSPPCTVRLKTVHQPLWHQPTLPRLSGSASGLFLHYGLYSQQREGEWYWHHHQVPHDDYLRLFDSFDPSGFDAPKLVAMAQDASFDISV